MEKIRKLPVSALFLAGLLLLGTALFLPGCGSSPEDGGGKPAAEETEEDGVSIGIVFDSFVIERWERDRDVFTATAKELGASVIVGNANGSPEEQKAIIGHFIESSVDIIVVVAVDGRALTDIVERAHRAGIQVISYDRIVNGADTDLYITFDNGAVGACMAEIINDTLPEGGSYVKVKGPSTDYNVTLVNEGFDRTIRSDLVLLDETECEGWNDEAAYRYMTDHPEDISGADAVMCGNDAIAGQVVRALAERRKAGQVTVTGQDADLEACQRIMEGTQTMTVYKPIEELAGRAAREAVAMAQGRTPDTAETINDGKYDIPYISIPPVRVTAENMDEVIIASGFHLQEDVYLHVNGE
ncbi:sugar ABC transporter substrate-binding protein [Lachnoclostridium sp. Marseille-P6806]|uniref:sugar ABC transporter substrate-binding protein n=1 Tax=Lachnoclostridium sp. Marseille-P6806 TaxID=2364793 RepID=UPI00102FB67E|nr:substrate-binding domain-containing protein [Lachnoclostridium sp. Marseille-P6806]